MDEKFYKFISTAGALFQKFFQFQSGGSQISDLKAHIQPVVEMRDFIYPPTSSSNTATTDASIAKKFPLHGGFGIYRIRGRVSFSGTTVLATLKKWELAAADLGGSTLSIITLLQASIPATTAYNHQSGDIDILFDIRDGGGQNTPSHFIMYFTTTTGDGTPNFNSEFIVAQRVI